MSLSDWNKIVIHSYYDPEVMLGKTPRKNGECQFDPDFWLVYNLILLIERNRDLILEQWCKKNQQLPEEQRTNYIGMVHRDCLFIVRWGLLFEKNMEDLIKLCEDRYDEMAFICQEVADQIHRKYVEYKWLKVCPKARFSMMD